MQRVVMSFLQTTGARPESAGASIALTETSATIHPTESAGFRGKRGRWLSVVMPIYNGERYLSAALQSIASQGDAVSGIEVIAVDDGSTDRSMEILADFSHRLPIRLIRPGRQGNWVKATNIGLEAAAGEWCCFLHQDDLWLPGRVADMRRAIDEQPDAAMAVHPSYFIDENGRRVGQWRMPLSGQTRLMPGRELWERLLVQNSLAINAPVFRRSRVLETGGMDENLSYTADWDLWLRLAKDGPVAVCPSALGCFRIHAQAQTAGMPPATMRWQLQAVFDRHRVGSEIWPPAASSVESLGRYSIALNLALAGWFHGEALGCGPLLAGWLRLGPVGWRRFLRDSRIVDRVAARLRARLASRGAIERDRPAATSTDGNSGDSGRG
jgi:GT2 family glycosyltransferase